MNNIFAGLVHFYNNTRTTVKNLMHLSVFVLLGMALLLSAMNKASALTFSPVDVLNSNANFDSGSDYAPQISTDSKGNWIAVWVSDENLEGTAGTGYDIFVSRSTDNGQTWSAPAVLNSNAETDSGRDSSPQISTDSKGNWIAVWVSDENLEGIAGTDYDIFVSRSTDNGQTWSAPAVLNSNAETDSGRDSSPQISTNSIGNWVVVWSSGENLDDTAGTDYDILFSRSTDNGQTWSVPAVLNSNAETDSGWDLNPQISTDSKGNWVAVWSSSESQEGATGADRDIFFSRSTDNGQSWSAPAVLNSNAGSVTWSNRSPQISTDSNGNWVAVWNFQEFWDTWAPLSSDIFFSRSTDNGQSWSESYQLNGNVYPDLGRDWNPQISTDSNDSWVAVWNSDEYLDDTTGNDSDIFVSRSTDNGQTWNAPAVLNSNAYSDSGRDLNPQISTDSNGNWIAVWSSGENLDGMVDTDSDIFFAYSVADATWYIGPWSSCTGPCGTDIGTRSRTVYCISSTGDQVSDSNCSETKPATSESCTASMCPVIPDSPEVSVSTNGLNVTLKWNSVIGASGYNLYYAPYPYTGPESVEFFDVGNTNDFSILLWNGAAYYVAIRSYNSAGESGYSNIEQFIIEHEQCSSVVGLHEINYSFEFYAGKLTIDFKADGDFSISGTTSGRWEQNNCKIDGYFDEGTHFWGDILGDGLMKGEVLSDGSKGTWNEGF